MKRAIALIALLTTLVFQSKACPLPQLSACYYTSNGNNYVKMSLSSQFVGCIESELAAQGQTFDMVLFLSPYTLNPAPFYGVRSGNTWTYNLGTTGGPNLNGVPLDFFIYTYQSGVFMQSTNLATANLSACSLPGPQDEDFGTIC